MVLMFDTVLHLPAYAADYLGSNRPAGDGSLRPQLFSGAFMNITPITVALAGVLIALSGCNRADNDRTTSVPPGADRAAIVGQTPLGLSAPPAPAERGPIPANANA